MSLINEALIDLEHRELNTPARLAGIKSMKESDKVSPINQKRSETKLMWLLGLSLLVASLFFGSWFVTSENSDNHTNKFSLQNGSLWSQLSNANTPSDLILSSEVNNDKSYHAHIDLSLRPQLLSEFSSQQVAEQLDNVATDIIRFENLFMIADASLGVELSNDSDLHRLLVQAEQALLEKRLTTPQGDNAYLYFSQSLTLDKNNEQAIHGIAKIKYEYLSLIEQAHMNQNSNLAEVLFNRLLNISTLEEQRGYELLIDKFVKHYKPSKSSEKEVVETSIVTDNKTPLEKNIEISISEIDNDKLLNEKYHQLVEDGDIEQAQSLLETEVFKKNASGMLVQALFQHYLKFEANSNLSILLSQRKELDEKWPYFEAKYIQLTKGDDAALHILAVQQLNGHLNGEKETSLFAALLNKHDQFKKAAEVYRSLLLDYPSATIYWLGLAVAEEALGNKSEAVKAYRFAEKHGQPQGEIANFVARKIESLSEFDTVSLELTQW